MTDTKTRDVIASKKTEQEEVSRGAGLMSIARTVGGIIDLLLILALTRLLDKSSFGTLAIVFLIQDTINDIGPMGINYALNFFVPRVGEDASRALGIHTSFILLGLALPYGLLLIIGGPPLATYLGHPTLGGPMVILGFASFVDIPGQVLPGYLTARQRYTGAFAVTLTFFIMRFFSLLIPAALGADIFWITISFAIVAVVRGVMLVIYLVFIAEGSLGTEIRSRWTTRELFRFGIPFALNMLTTKLNVNLDKYMIITLASVEVFAIYSVGANEVPLVPALAYASTIATVPVLIKRYRNNKPEEFVKLWHGMMAKVALIMMPTFALLLILAEPVMRTIFSTPYADATVPFRVYLFLLPLRLCSYGQVTSALGSTRPLLAAGIIQLIVNTAFNYPFYLIFGLAGPAIAAVLAQLSGIVVMLTAVKRGLNLTWWTVFPYRAAGHALGVALVAAIPLYLLTEYLEGDVIILITGIPLYFICYFSLATTVGLITRTDLRYIANLIRIKQ